MSFPFRQHCTRRCHKSLLGELATSSTGRGALQTAPVFLLTSYHMPFPFASFALCPCLINHKHVCDSMWKLSPLSESRNLNVLGDLTQDLRPLLPHPLTLTCLLFCTSRTDLLAGYQTFQTDTCVVFSKIFSSGNPFVCFHHLFHVKLLFSLPGTLLDYPIHNYNPSDNSLDFLHLFFFFFNRIHIQFNKGRDLCSFHLLLTLPLPSLRSLPGT